MKMKKQLLALLLAAVMVLSLTGCKETLKKVAQKVTGHCGGLGKVCHRHRRRLPVRGVQRHLEPQHRLLYRAGR